MAIYHLSVRTLGRSAGRSAVAAAAYRAGARLRCERTGRIHDYSRRHGVVSSRVVVPQGETTMDRQQLWDRAEAAETRSNSTVAREFEIALPAELDVAAREALALRFATALAARYGIAVDVAVHEPSRTGDERNHHCHLLTSTRTWNAGAFGRKVRSLDDRRTGPAEITAMREAWAAMCNTALAAAGVAGTVDHRSHQARGVADVPSNKIGPAATGLERRTREVSRRRADQDAERAAGAQAKPVPPLGKDGVGAGQPGSDRRRAQRLVLGQLRQSFAAATAAAMAGRAHPLLGGVLRPTASPRPLRSAVGHRTFSARPTLPALSVKPSPPVLLSTAAKSAAPRKREAYDEVAEAAAMYRRVERELDAEHRAHLTAQQAEAERVASVADRQRLSPTSVIGSDKRPALSGAGAPIKLRPAPSNLVRRPADKGSVERPITVQDGAVHGAGGARPSGAEAPTGQDIARRELALMLARELGRRHKRSRARLSRLARAAGLDEAAFAAAVAAAGELRFDSDAIASDPALGPIWRAWADEDRAKQRDRATPEAVAQAASPAIAPAETEPGGPGPAEDGEAPDGGATPTPVRPYGRRDVVIGHAILVIARGRWTTDVGDALAGLLNTHRNWIWREAHRVCRARHGSGRPGRVAGEQRDAIARAVAAGARVNPQLARTLHAIDRGQLGRGRG